MYQSFNKTSENITLLLLIVFFLINPLLTLFISLPIYNLFLYFDKNTFKSHIVFGIQLTFLALLLAGKDTLIGTHNDIETYLKLFESYGNNIQDAVKIGLQYIGAFDYFFILCTFALENIFNNPKIVLSIWILMAILITIYSLIKILGREAFLAWGFIIGNINLFVLYGNAIRQAFSMGVLGLLIWVICHKNKTNKIEEWIVFTLGLLSHNSFIIFLPLLISKYIRFILNLEPIILSITVFASIPFSLITRSIAIQIFSLLPFNIRYLNYESQDYFTSGTLILSLLICVLITTFYYFKPKQVNKKLFNVLMLSMIICVLLSAIIYSRIYGYILIISSIQLALIPSFFSNQEKPLVKVFLFLNFLILGIFFWNTWFDKFGNSHFESSIGELLSFNIYDYILKWNHYFYGV